MAVNGYIKEIHSQVGKMSAFNILHKLLNDYVKKAESKASKVAFLGAKPGIFSASLRKALGVLPKTNESKKTSRESSSRRVTSSQPITTVTVIQAPNALEKLIRNLNQHVESLANTQDDLYVRLSAFVTVFPHCIILFSDEIRPKTQPLLWTEQHEFEKKVKQKLEQAMKSETIKQTDEKVTAPKELEEEEFSNIFKVLNSSRSYDRGISFVRAATTIERQSQEQKQKIIGKIQEYIGNMANLSNDMRDNFCKAIFAYLPDYPEKERACNCIKTIVRTLVDSMRHDPQYYLDTDCQSVGETCFDGMSANPYFFHDEVSIKLAEEAIAFPKMPVVVIAAAISFLMKVYDDEKKTRLEIFIVKKIKAVQESWEMEMYIQLFVEMQKWKESCHVKPVVRHELRQFLPPPLCELILAY